MHDITNNGERIFINYNNLDYNKFDIYQKSHFKRYEFAKKYLTKDDCVGDFACGTGYGSLMLKQHCKTVIGGDLSIKVIEFLNKTYSVDGCRFVNIDITKLDLSPTILDAIVSFETIEHVTEDMIIKALQNYNKNLKHGGKLIFSVPYMQEASQIALKMGHHKTFYINESKINAWLSSTGFVIKDMNYQNYTTHEIVPILSEKDFIIVMAEKI